MGQHAIGARPRGASVQFPGVVRDAVFGGLRHRTAVFRCGRARAAFCFAPGGRCADGGCSETGDANRFLSLGLSHLVDLWPDRIGTGVLCVSSWSATVHAFGPVPADWRAYLRPDWSYGG